jgi:N-acetylmuramoyl-L-alanine amidase
MAAMLLCMPANAQNKANSLGLNTICIDPGHGGRDPGCVAPDGTKEKDIVLSVGLKLKKYLNEGYPDMKVVMTRSDDRFIELSERAAIANRNNSDLFVSIHVNAVDTKKNRNYANITGFSIHTLGQSRTGADLYSNNMELCKRENSVILLENDYDTAYQGFNPNDPESYIIFNLMQNSNLVQSLSFADKVATTLTNGPVKKNRGVSQDPFLVLWRTTMPAALIELGFITCPADLAKIKTDAGQEEIAKNIYNAIVSYKKEYDHSMNVTPVEPIVKTNKAETAKEEKTSREVKATQEVKPVQEVKEKSSDAAVRYGVQVLASSRLMNMDDSFFQGYDPVYVKNGNLYKYFVGTSESLDAVKESYSQIIKKFSSGFIVRIEGDKVERVR